MVARLPAPGDGLAGVAVCLVVPHGTHRPHELARAILEHHPTWTVGAIWCGDPQLHPAAQHGSSTVRWWDEDRPIDEHLLVASAPLRAEWSHALDTVDALLARGAERVLVAWVGAVAVLGPLHPLVEVEPAPAVVLVPKVREGVVPDDGLVPDVAALLAEGPDHAHVAVFSRGSSHVIDAIRSGLLGGDEAPGDGDAVGLLLARVSLDHPVHRCEDAAIGVGAWRWPDPATGIVPAMLVVPDHDTDRPWTLSRHTRRPMRVELVGHPARARTMGDVAPQLDGSRTALRLPGGIVVDDVVRRVAASHPAVRPWSSPSAFRRILDDEYWSVLHEDRADLRRAFPDPRGSSTSTFAAWRRLAFVDDAAPMLLRPVAPVAPAAVAPASAAGAVSAPGVPTVEVVTPPATGGVNVVGYLSRSMGLGEIGRRLADACAAAGLAVSTVDHRRTDSPAASTAPPIDDVIRYDSSIAVVNADQWNGLLTDLPALREGRRRLIGYWFWEVDHVPEVMRRAMRHVDEVWTATHFVADALSAVGEVPVRLMPLPIPAPVSSSRARTDFPPLRDSSDAFVFLVSFDHVSVTERKNPLAAIDAYRRAFAEDDGAVLLVKTMNARHRPRQHARLLAAADGRHDVRVWDAALPRPDLMALVATADCVVSLHRSEGLGLHLAEAMWLGTPTIATRWSGNLDLADERSAALIDADLVPVCHGEGVYAGTAHWAEPRLDLAVDAMRRMVADAPWRASLVAEASARMHRQPTLASAGHAIVAALQERS